MEKLKFYSSVLLISVLIFTWGCDSSEVDIDPPIIQDIVYSPVPATGEICGGEEPTVFNLNGGDQLSFDVLFTDNLALSQYKVDIHNNFDCHGHGGGTAPSTPIPIVDSETIDWTVLDILNISGTSVSDTRAVVVPENVTAGNYHFHIQVIDEAGNDSPFSNFNSIKILNTTDVVAPEITVTQPEPSFSISTGETIRFSGQVTDNFSLSTGGNGVLYLAYTDLDSGNTFTTDKSFFFDASVNTSFDFDFEYTVPLTLPSGSYRYSLGANDGVRNVGEFQFFEVEVTN